MPKNTKSKQDDAKVRMAMDEVISYLDTRFNLADLGYYVDYVKAINLSELIEIIKGYEKRTEFATTDARVNNGTRFFFDAIIE